MTTLPLWTGSDIAAATGARFVGNAPATIAGISIDSRTVKPGELYVAIKGDVHDGHDFVAAALRNGAAAALVSYNGLKSLGDTNPLFVVGDALEGLIALGRAARQRSQAKIIAVTGSAGKTGTKDALGAILSAQAETHFSVASFNNHWGVPLTLARFSASARFGVFEIGMNHAGEITPLVNMVKPHIAIVTTIAPVHLAHFASTDAIADAKAEIFSGVVTGGVAIINGDIPQTRRLCDHADHAGIGRVITFGEKPECAARLLGCTLDSHSSAVTADILGRRVEYRIGSPGKHIIMNSLAVLAACVESGADLARAATHFAHVTPPSGRGARMPLRIGSGAFELIDESYNANPASMKAALDNLGRTVVTGRRIAVLGDMLELGPEAPAMHRILVDDLVRNRIDTVFLSGPMMAHLWDALPAAMRGLHVSAAAQLEEPLRDAVRAGDAVTVKGSLGSKMGPLVKMLIQKYPPVETRSG